MAPLKLAVFDLDYTIWEPEMYQLDGPPKLIPISTNNCRSSTQTCVEEGKQVVDQSNTPINIFDGASHALSEINRLNQKDPKYIQSPIQTAIASKTDEPVWARKCLQWLTIQDGSTLDSMFPPKLIQISYNRKTVHLTNLHKITGIPFESMMFFDNEYGNIRDVKKLGVKCVYTPDGMSRDHWDKTMEMFD